MYPAECRAAAVAVANQELRPTADFVEHVRYAVARLGDVQLPVLGAALGHFVGHEEHVLDGDRVRGVLVQITRVPPAAVDVIGFRIDDLRADLIGPAIADLPLVDVGLRGLVRSEEGLAVRPQAGVFRGFLAVGAVVVVGLPGGQAGGMVGILRDLEVVRAQLVRRGHGEIVPPGRAEGGEVQMGDIIARFAVLVPAIELHQRLGIVRQFPHGTIGLLVSQFNLQAVRDGCIGSHHGHLGPLRPITDLIHPDADRRGRGHDRQRCGSVCRECETCCSQQQDESKTTHGIPPLVEMGRREEISVSGILGILPCVLPADHEGPEFSCSLAWAMLSNMPTPKPKPPRYQFSLRSLLLLTLVIAVLCSIGVCTHWLVSAVIALPVAIGGIAGWIVAGTGEGFVMGIVVGIPVLLGDFVGSAPHFCQLSHKSWRCAGNCLRHFI